MPHNVHVERHIEIQRPAATVFTVLNTYRTFQSWSPWAQRDPEAVYRFSGPDAGRGAKMLWNGDPRLVGSGWQEITASEPYSLVGMHLEFDQQGSADSYFRIDERAHGVRVTWGFDTDLLEEQSWFGGLFARYFGLFFDRWIGSDYEAGLSRLKALLESMPPTDFSDLSVEIIQIEPQDMLYVSSAAGGDSAEAGSSLAAAYREITAFMTEYKIEMAAQPMAITRMLGEKSYDVEAAIPVVFTDPGLSGDALSTGRVRLGRTPSGRALRVIHTGPYDQMAPSYEKLAAWMTAHGLAEGQVSWEQYISDPRQSASVDLETHIYFLLDDDQ